MAEHLESSQNPTKVFLTVDSEFTVDRVCPDFTEMHTAAERDIWGRTPKGDYGLTYLLNKFDEYKLKAVFFVEALAASVVGDWYLRPMLEAIIKAGQDVQLHVHTEWLWPENEISQGVTGANLHDFPFELQHRLLELASDNLHTRDVPRVKAFRAGNFGANLDTLKALSLLGITYDTSYNAGYLDSTCKIQLNDCPLQPFQHDQALVFPISCLQDYPSHQRHLQVTAVSFGEMKNALKKARRLGWNYVVVLLHTFELIRRTGTCRYSPLPDALNINRFERLCNFLDSHRESFETCTFADLDPSGLVLNHKPEPIISKPWLTGARMTQQLFRKFINTNV